MAVQERMRGSVSREAPTAALRTVAGLDAAFSPDGQQCIAGVVLWDIERQCSLEEHTAARTLRFPYVPGLLSFREVPALLAALRKLTRAPDALMCDGQGLAHPRRFGLACHVGVLCGLPSVGCAKSRLIGTHGEPLGTRGGRIPLLDRGEVIGTVLRTKDGVRPVYVSIGHKMDLSAAESLVLRCAVQYRLPEPTRLADRLVAAARRNWNLEI
jgi:deoxyribonuclease V